MTETKHSILFDRLKRLYDNGEIDKERLATFVVRKAITADEYKEITGEDYVA